MKIKIPNFTEFVAEYSEFDGIDKSLAEEKHDFTPEEKEEWKRGMDQDFAKVEELHKEKHAQQYLEHMLSQFPEFNSDQFQILIDRTARKFELSDEQKQSVADKVLNSGEDEMHESAQLHLGQMDKDVKKLRKWGHRSSLIKKYEDWNPLGSRKK